MIDISSERLLTLAQAARIRPPGRRGRPTHPSTVYRWIAQGLKSHKLEAIRLGGTLYTSAEALQRFAERLTSGADGNGPQPPGACVSPRSPPATTAAELDRLGL